MSCQSCRACNAKWQSSGNTCSIIHSEEEDSVKTPLLLVVTGYPASTRAQCNCFGAECRKIKVYWTWCTLEQVTMEPSTAGVKVRIRAIWWLLISCNLIKKRSVVCFIITLPLDDETWDDTKDLAIVVISLCFAAPQFVVIVLRLMVPACRPINRWSIWELKCEKWETRGMLSSIRASVTRDFNPNFHLHYYYDYSCLLF